jgi:hypothetical protein
MVLWPFDPEIPSLPICISWTDTDFGLVFQRWYTKRPMCVCMWNCGDVTFGRGPVTLILKFPSALYLLNGCRFCRIGFCKDDVLGDKGVSCGKIMMWPLTWKFPSTVSPKHLQILEWLQGWTKVCCMVNAWCRNISPLPCTCQFSVLHQAMGMLSLVCAHKWIYDWKSCQECSCALVNLV